MDCNCNNNSVKDEKVIRHVFGNVLRLAIPLTLRTVTVNDGEAEHTDTDFVPSSAYPVNVVFSKATKQITIEATMRDGNIAYIEDKGKIPVGAYDITITCNDDNGNPYRFKQSCILRVVDYTAEAGIVADIEYQVETWYLDPAIYLALKGEDGVGIQEITTEYSEDIGGMNIITIVLTDGRTHTFTVMNGAGSVDSDLDADSPYPIANKAVTERFNAVDQAMDGLFGDVDYDDQNKVIRFFNKEKTSVLATLDSRQFIKDGMVSNVYINNGFLVITFNTDSGKSPIGISLSQIFNPNNYYTRTQVNNLLGDYYNRSEINSLVNDKADLLDDGRVPAIEATPVVLDYIYAPPSGSPIIPINPQAGEVIYFANEKKIRRYYYEDAGQSGGFPAIVYVEETPSRYVVYYNKGNEKFYRYDAGSLSMVEIEAGSGGGEGTVTGVKVGSTTYEPTDGVVDISAGIPDVDTAIAGLADVARTGDYDDLENKPTIPDVSNLATKSELQGKANASDVYTKTEVDNALALKQGNITDLDQIREGATRGVTAYQKPYGGIPASDLADGVIPDVSGFATSSDVADAVADLVNSAPATLDTLKELSDALGDDPNFATTMTTALGNKVDKVSGKGLSTEDYTTAEKTKLANLATVATTGSYNDLTDKPSIPSPYDDTALAGRVSALENAGFITTETDPNVPNWAKADTKPTYTAQEVGALPSSTPIPSKTSDLTNDSGFIDKVLYYGTCATAASTMPKVCTVESFPTTTSGNVTHAKDGTIIAVKFTNSDTNTTAAPTLNVNGIGEKAIMYNNAIITSTAKNTTVAGYAKQIAYYRYDPELDEGNGAWEYLGKSVDSNSTYSPVSLGFGYASQSNASASATITATLSSYTLTTNGIVAVKFTYDVPASATLNINSKGAKAIYNQGAAIAAGVIKAGDTATFIYSTYYHLIAIDSWQDKQDAIDDLADIRSGATAGATAIQSSDLATVATTGAYSDLSGKPSLATVATSGSYNDLSNKPTLFSGNYNDLTNKPTIPDVSGLATKSEVATGLATKQDTLTFDNAPTANSNNVVRSGGIKQAIDDKLTEVTLTEISGAADIVVIDDADLAFIDQQGNIAMQVANGHIQTSEFDSAQVKAQVAANSASVASINQQIAGIGGQSDVAVKNDDDAPFDISDAAGNVVLRINEQGHVSTKRFDSQFAAMTLGTPMCISHAVNSPLGTAYNHTMKHFRASIAHGHQFIECDGYNCMDGVPVCAHDSSYSFYVKNSTTGETASKSFSSINSADLIAGYTWTAPTIEDGVITEYGEPIIKVTDLLYFVCYIHRCNLYIDAKGMTAQSVKDVLDYAESIGCRQLVWIEPSAPGLSLSGIQCNICATSVTLENMASKIAANKRDGYNLMLHLVSTTNPGPSRKTRREFADAAHSYGCYAYTWPCSSAEVVSGWFEDGFDFIFTEYYWVSKYKVFNYG